MRSTDVQERIGTPRRRTVRIVKPRTVSGPVIASFALAIGAVFCTLALWRYWQHHEVVSPPQTTLGEWETDWKCDSGHTFHAAGQVEPRACWTCGKPAYPVAYYRCPEHGTFEVNARFAIGDDGVPRVAYVRLRGGEWTDVKSGLRCPRCGKPLQYAGKDPLRSLANERGGGGG